MNWTAVSIFIFNLFNFKSNSLFIHLNFVVALVPEKCPENYKRCEHGMCIEKSLWCNGQNDCGDFSDELHCKPDSIEILCEDDESETKKFQCRFNKTICIELSQHCDGKSDCPNGEDELDCSDCTSAEFKCRTGQCIRSDWYCDGFKGNYIITQF